MIHKRENNDLFLPDRNKMYTVKILAYLSIIPQSKLTTKSTKKSIMTTQFNTLLMTGSTSSDCGAGKNQHTDQTDLFLQLYYESEFSKN